MAGPLDQLIAAQTSANPSVLLAPDQVSRAQVAPLAAGGTTPLPNSVPSVNASIPRPMLPAGTPTAVGSVNGGFASPQERWDFVQREAIARGLDPAKVRALGNSEGGWSGFDTTGDSGTSFGPFQMHVSGTAPGTSASGLGDEFRAATGLDPSLPQNEKALSLFALDQLKIHGFDPNIWHGLRSAGVSVGDMAAQVRRVQADQGAAAGRLDATAQGLIKQIGAERGNLDESMKRVRAAQDKADQANDAALAAISKAPAQPEIDGVKQLNGLAVLVGVLGGLFTKSPMRTSINAAASAIEAYNDHDREKYQVAYKNWVTQTGLLFKIADMTQSRVRDILYDEQMGANERNALLDTTLRAAGLPQLADKLRTEGDSVVLDWMEKMQSAKTAHEDRMAQMQQTHELALLRLSMSPSQAGMVEQMVNQWAAEVEQATGQPPSTEDRIAKTTAIANAMKGTASSQRVQSVNKVVQSDVEQFKADNPTATKAQI